MQKTSQAKEYLEDCVGIIDDSYDAENVVTCLWAWTYSKLQAKSEANKLLENLGIS